MQSKFSLIIWDFNGTIIDDVNAALNAVNDILRKREREPIDLETYRSYIDTPIIKFYEKLFDLSEVSFSELSSEFHKNYEKHECFCTVTPGIIEIIDKLSSAGARHVICSASERSKVEQQLHDLGIADRFSHIIAADDRAAGSKIERAKEYMRLCRAEPTKTLMIGDCVHDFDTASAIGAECALLTSGHQLKTDLLKCKAIVVDTARELLPHLFIQGGDD